MAAVLEREAKGTCDVAEYLGSGRSPTRSPGYSWGPPVPEAMRRMGIPVLSDAPFEWDRGEPMWYQNMLSCPTALRRVLRQAPQPAAQRMKADFERRVDNFKNRTLVMYTHPCRLVTSEFWDLHNFAHGENLPRDLWRPGPNPPAGGDRRSEKRLRRLRRVGRKA